MAFGMRHLGRSIRRSLPRVSRSGLLRSLSAGLLLLAGASGQSQRSSHTVTTPPAAQDRSALVQHEVRLRKLHLVRPDLIPYPVCYEIYC